MQKIGAFFHHRSIRTRYILSYLLIMALPLIALIWLLCDYQIKNLMKSVDELQIYRMEQVRDSLDMRFQDIGQISAQIANEYKLQPSYLLSLRSHAMEAATLLSGYNSRNTLTRNVYLYLSRDKTIYANDGCMSLDALTDIAYRMNDNDKTWFMDLIQTAENKIIQPVTIERTSRQISGETKMLIMLYPLRFEGGRPYGVLFYLIRQDAMLSIMRDALGDSEASILIYNTDGEPVAGDVPNGSGMEAIEEAGSGVAQIVSENGSWSVIYSASKKAGLNYAVLYPAKTMLVQVVKQKMAVYQISSIILLLGIGISLIMAWLNYRPIHGLLTDVGLSVRNPVFNELEAIKNSFAVMIDRNRLLNQRVEKHTSYIIEHVIELALEGNINEQEAIDMLGEERTCFTMPCFQVLAVDKAGVEKTGLNAGINQTILHAVADMEASCRQKIRLYAVDRSQDGIVIILINMNAQSPGNGTSYGHLLYEHFKRSVGEPLLAGMGIAYDGIDQIQRSFIEAMAALESARFQKMGGLLIFSEFDSSKYNSDDCLLDELQRMVQSVKQGNANMACLYLGNIYNNILMKNISSEMVRCNLLGIINTIVKYVIELAPGQFTKQINNLMTVHSLDKFSRDMRELIIPVCDFIKSQQISAADLMCDRLLSYVEKHYTEAEFSLECIANHFQLSTSFISRIFSEHTSMPFKDHVSLLRIEQAKRLLVNTDLPLQEIVLNVGYINTSNFIKKFKLYTGKTPGEWRSISNYVDKKSVS